MDQGWAALVGAAIGAVFGSGAAIAAAWLGRNGMKLQAQSTREQWRREVLRDACIEFVEASRLQVHAIRRYHALIMFDQQGFDRDPEQIRRNYYERGTRTQAAGLVLELEGNHELRGAAAMVLKAAREIPHLQEDHGNYLEAQEKTQRMWEATDEFVRIARTLLAL